MAAPDETARLCKGSQWSSRLFNQALRQLLLRTKVTACLEQTRLREQLVHYKGVVEEFREQKKQTSASNSKLQLELEQIKRSQQVSEIVQTNYFQQLQPPC